MADEPHALVADLQDLHTRLIECYDFVEELRHRPGLGPQLAESLAGLHYSVAKAAQHAGELLEKS